ncbi:MAG: hypothetical protein J6V21_04405 [Alistipes sp.]|nr:hypothetical protein [Alistipes sp.]
MKDESGKLFVRQQKWHLMAFGLSALDGKRSLTTAEWQVGETIFLSLSER